MYFDFKVSYWQRVTVDEDQEDAVLEQMEVGKIQTADGIFNFLAEKGDMNVKCDLIENTEEELTPKDNDGQSTCEAFTNNGITLYQNGETKDEKRTLPEPDNSELIKVCCELADDRADDENIFVHGEEFQKWKDPEAQSTEYTDEFQKIFNHWYDYYWGMLQPLTTGGGA